MENTTYVLEVLQFITEKDGDEGWLLQGGKIKTYWLYEGEI